MHDPQHLSTLGSVKALLALGRIPLASEVPIWCFLGCLLSSQIFNRSGLDWLATLQCVLVVWGTNISINYGNEYFDYAMDRPGMVASIERDIKAREEVKRELMEKKRGEQLSRSAQEAVRQAFGNEKIMGSSSRILHDGTFPPYVALLCATFVQALLFALILTSRVYMPSSTPFRGLALEIGILCTFLSQTYVGPPLRLHYHGLGELVSALLLSPVAVLFGMAGHYTASTNRSISLIDLFSTAKTSTSGFHLDRQLWYMFLAFYFFEQARILIMHIHDIDADKKGGKMTFVVRVGYDWAKRLYVVLNAVSLVFFTLLARSMASGEGMIMKGANMLVLGVPSVRSRSVLAGLTILAAFALPIIVITARSLYYHSPSNRGKPDAGTTIPVLPHADLAKIVSLQTLLSPAILSVAFGLVSR